MANTLNGNSFYVDTAFNTSAEDLVRSQALVAYVIVTATGANGRIVLGDVGANSSQTKIDLRVEVSGHSEIFRFAENPVLFPNGVRVLSLSNAVASIIIKNPGG